MDEFIKNLKKAKDDPINMWWYVQGTFRMWLYNHARWALRKHIVEQFEWRKGRAGQCTINKSCLFCGCTTPDLYFADKGCGLAKVNDDFTRILIAKRKTVCYPPMMTAQKWKINK